MLSMYLQARTLIISLWGPEDAVAMEQNLHQFKTQEGGDGGIEVGLDNTYSMGSIYNYHW